MNRPNSIGKAIPNAQILVLNQNGERCGPNECGELVHRGPMVALGYWNNPKKTATFFKPLDNGTRTGVSETVVYSGDTVRQDEEGYFYFIGRSDDMITCSGYRINPAEIEEVIYGNDLVQEAIAIGVDHPELGQSLVVVAHGRNLKISDTECLLAQCRKELPAYMVPYRIIIWQNNIFPHNSNGEIDRQIIKNQIQRSNYHC